MKLDQLYSLRTSFTVIGLTGRLGSGCSKIAGILKSDFKTLEDGGLRDLTAFNDPVFLRKYQICKNYLATHSNWQNFEVIKYVNVIIFFTLHKLGTNTENYKQLLQGKFKETKSQDNSSIISELFPKVKEIIKHHAPLIDKISGLKPFNNIKENSDLEMLHDLFFGSDFEDLTTNLFSTLEQECYFRTRCLLHWLACDIRGTGDPLGRTPKDVNNVYSIALLINRIIKAEKAANGDSKPTKVVIDSLRNSLEIMFFKERYSAFYMVAAKDVLNNAQDRIEARLKLKALGGQDKKKLLKNLIELDAIEYETKDFSKGDFSSPDVANCIQKSDFHICNVKKENLPTEQINGFFTREEQLMKLISLINQPGLITPSSAERVMQIANTAKLNSGCISRQVGAVVTDSKYYVLSIGWNDVAKGHTPCNLRSVEDFLQPLGAEYPVNKEHYSNFENAIGIESSAYKYKSRTPGNFKEAMVDFFKTDFAARKGDLSGKNCSFCFKSIHNYYEGEANQVHTRSLHAEENAMLQITKLGGIGAQDGILFTTASPCELCAKKAYQLGIAKIFYIDPYPGIAIEQILQGGRLQPALIPFSGAIGRAYHKLYEGFMAYKDEIAMTLEINPKVSSKIDFGNLLKKIKTDDVSQNAETEFTEDEIEAIITAGLKTLKRK